MPIARTGRWVKWAVFFFAVLLMTAMASANTVCHVSLLGFEEENALLRTEFMKATGASMERLKSRVDFFENNPAAVKYCLEHNYATVLITAHSAEITPDAVSLVYFSEIPGLNGKAINFFPDRAFAAAKISPKLKRLLIATCEAEKLWANYPRLVEMANTNGVALGTAQPDLYETREGGVLALRSYRAAGELLKRALKRP